MPQKCGVAKLVKANGSNGQTRRIVLSLKNDSCLRIVAQPASHTRNGSAVVTIQHAGSFLAQPQMTHTKERAEVIRGGSRKPNVLP
jgi:predicted alpha/beta hydrolase family esterase